MKIKTFKTFDEAFKFANCKVGSFMIENVSTEKLFRVTLYP